MILKDLEINFKTKERKVQSIKQPLENYNHNLREKLIKLIENNNNFMKQLKK